MTSCRSTRRRQFPWRGPTPFLPERCWKHGYGDFIKAPEEFYLLFISRLEILWSLDLLDRDFFSRLWVEVSAHQSITNTMDTVEIKEFLYLFADEVLQELYPNTSEREVVQTGVKEAFGLLVREFIERDSRSFGDEVHQAAGALRSETRGAQRQSQDCLWHSRCAHRFSQKQDILQEAAECMFVDIEWCRSPTYWTHEMLVEEAQETAKVLWATCTAVCVLRYPKMRQLRYYQRYSELLDILRSAVVFKCAYQMKDFEWLKQELAKIGAKTE